MKRRVISLITALALCLSLCPAGVRAIDEAQDDALCPHHQSHTPECGYLPAQPGQECAHTHNESCYAVETECSHVHDESCFPEAAEEDFPAAEPEPSRCAHVCSDATGCRASTLDCQHVHDESCGFAEAVPASPCGFVCPACPIDALIAQLPDSVTGENRQQVQSLLIDILSRYNELEPDQEDWVDLSLCMELQYQLDAASRPMTMETGKLNDDLLIKIDAQPIYYDVEVLLDLDGYSITTESNRSGTSTVAVQVEPTGSLTITNTSANTSCITSTGNNAVEVLSGGSLTVNTANVVITSNKGYALNIASGAKSVKLSGGKYTGSTTAICAPGDFSNLLAPGCAFFDGSGNLLTPADAKTAKTLVVGTCTHSFTYAADSGKPSHSATCPYCGAKDTKNCAFDFSKGYNLKCSSCDHRIVVDETNAGNPIYNGQSQTANVSFEVTLRTGVNTTMLREPTDYTVTRSSRDDVGELTVTVTGKTFDGSFTKTYRLNEDTPVIRWGSTSTTLDYDGSRTSTSILNDLPPIIITNAANEDLHGYLQYSYKKTDDSDFKEGLPLEAGTYQVKACLPARTNYNPAETAEPLTLTISKIDPVTTLPEAEKNLIYNREPQQLVTPGVVDSRATGAEILFAASEKSELSDEQPDPLTFSAAIPTGTNAKDYNVWFKVVGTNNYNAVAPTKIENVTIAPKEITPTVEVSVSSYGYDGTAKTPTITVKDGDTTIEPAQYDITWTWKDVDADPEDHTEGKTVNELRLAGTYTATIQSVDGGNYVFTATTQVEIVTADQQALHITGQPDHVRYGDKITTLRTTGGTENGTVTWSISPAPSAAGQPATTINPSTGELEVKAMGPFKITAQRVVPNYGTVTDTWSFTVEPKPVTAVVTVEDKVYDGETKIDADSLISADLNPDDLVNDGDTVEISGLKGSYDNPNAGSGKTVTLDCGAAKVDGADKDKYAVSYPATVTGKINPRPVSVVEVTLSGNDLKTETDENQKVVYYYDYDGNEKKPSVSSVTVQDPVENPDETTFSKPLAPSDFSVDYANNKNVTTNAEVILTNTPNGNYTFAETKVPFEIRDDAAVLTASPQANDLTFNGSDQNLVSVGTATGGTVLYALYREEPGQPELPDEDSYKENIPQAKNAGTYKVFYMVKGDANHKDTDPAYVFVTIKPKEFTPIITVAPTNVTYDGTPQTLEPDSITVEDGDNIVDPSEYSVSYRDNVDAGTATVIVSDNNGGNYIVNGTATFKIEKAASTFTKAPEVKQNLKYSGQPQELVTAGGSSHGTVVYSLNGGNYSTVLPTATAVNSAYSVSYKILGDKNHEDTTPVELTVGIDKNTVNNPAISLSSETFRYNGSQQKPSITVCDDNGHLIPDYEYTVTFIGEKSNNMVDVDTYTVTITAKDDSNYDITTADNKNTRTYEIVPANQQTISITNTKTSVFYGDVIQLGTTAGTGGSSVTWEVKYKNAGGESLDWITDTGLLTVKDAGGPITVTATSTADNHESVSASWEFTAANKPVTAVVSVKPKYYDGTKNVDTDIDGNPAISASVNPKDLVEGDAINISITNPDDPTSVGLTGSYDDPNAGSGKTVFLSLDRDNLSVSGTNWGRYDISFPATATSSILKADIKTSDVIPPTPITDDLVYSGLPLTLIGAGSSPKGTLLEYSLDNISFSVSLPTGIDAGEYTIWYRVKGGGNYNDSDAVKLDNAVTIDQQFVETPIIEFTPNSVTYDGAAHKPSVTVKDNNARVIPEGEYTVEYVGYSDTPWVAAGEYQVKITDKDKNGGNYSFEEDGATATFTIYQLGQSPLTILNQPGKVQYGDSFTLAASGGSGNGAVTWESSDTDVASIDQNGLVKVGGCGSVTITATKAGDINHPETSATWSFNAEKRAVTPIVTAKNKVFDGSDNAELVISWKNGDLLGNDSISLDGYLTGTFDDANVGTNKTVTISGSLPENDKYAVTLPNSTTASITPATAVVTDVQGKDTLTYDGTQQELLANLGSVTGENSNTIGSVLYSMDGGATYSLDKPMATNAGTYTIWYKADVTGNYVSGVPQSVKVTIEPKKVTNDTPLVIELSEGTFNYDGTAKKPDVVAVKDGGNVIPSSEYTVSYGNNVNVGTATVTISDVTGGNYDVSGFTTFTIIGSVATLVAPPTARNLTYNGNKQTLVTAGRALNGQLEYSLVNEDGSYATSIPQKDNAGDYEVWYRVKGNSGFANTIPDFVPVTILPRTTAPRLTLVPDSFEYDGTPKKPVVTVTVSGTTLDLEDYDVTYINNIDPGTATVLVVSTSDNYQFSASKTFTITKAKAAFDENKEPKAAENLVFTGEPQALIAERGESENGFVLYSRDGVTYSFDIPVGTEVGSYLVCAKVLGNSTYSDSDVKYYTVNILQNVIAGDKLNNLIVSLPAKNITYTGQPLTPAVTVTYDGKEIPSSEYSTEYKDNTEVGEASVTVKSKGNNYSFETTVNFTIVDPDQPPLEITNKPEAVFYGDFLNLSTTGGSGTVSWSVNPADGSIIAGSDGHYTIKKSGNITITATCGDNAVSDTWEFFAQPRPATAVISAVDKVYNGDTEAALKVTLNGLLASDAAELANAVTATGDFLDKNVGAAKTVLISSVTIPENVSEKYDVSYDNSSLTASITPKTASVKEGREPKAVDGLTYSSDPQQLVSAGESDDGLIAYSLDGANFSYTIPTGTNAGLYSVWFKVVATDDNYKNSAPQAVSGTITISPNTVQPTVMCVPGTVQFDGSEKNPTVVVRDNNLHIIPESEYTAEFDKPLVAPGSYTVTVTDKAGGNYEFTEPVTATFTITSASQNPLSIVTDIPTNVQYGDSFKLSAIGGSGSGTIEWSIAETGVAEINDNGVVTVKDVGGFTVKAYRKGDDNYNDSNTDFIPFDAKPKSITPVVTAVDRPYNGDINATLFVSWKTGDLVGSDKLKFDVTGEFLDENVGVGKIVRVTGHNPTNDEDNLVNANVNKYSIDWPTTTTASIYKVDAKIASVPQLSNSSLPYTGDSQCLVNENFPGSTDNRIGTIEYSLSQYGVYSSDIPTATEAGTYTVWFRVPDTINYTGIPAAKLGDVTIQAPPVENPPSGGTSDEEQVVDTPVEVPDVGQPGETPSVEAPTVVNPPVEENPGENQPDEENPGEEPSGEEPSGENPSDEENPGEEPSGEENPGEAPSDEENPPVVDTPDENPPVVNTPDENPPVVNTPENPGASTELDPQDALTPPLSTFTQPVGNKATSSSRSPVKSPAKDSSPVISRDFSQTTVADGSAYTTVSASAADLLKEAAVNQNDNVVIKPVISDSVTKSQVSIPASTVSQFIDLSSANLTVSTPLADVTIPNAALAALANAGGNLNVVAELLDNGISISLSAGGVSVQHVPDGLTVSLPAPDTTPGTVAVLVHQDGSEEIVRKAVPNDGSISVHVGGPVVLKIVDNSKSFSDVKQGSWQADAAAFVSAHELFNGTSESAFSPDQPMSRAMLTTVLYNLEGNPLHDPDASFSDVDSGAWYAASVAWAADNGITNGLDNGLFGPDNPVSREQFAVMLWKYAGSPVAAASELNFTDADLVSSYAVDALRWAAANGIINGMGNGLLDPGGTVTRAQAAQLLKNFLEHT